MVKLHSEVLSSGVALVSAEGTLDLTAAPMLRGELQTLVKNGAVQLVVDLSDVEFIDSTGLGALISGLKAARKNGGDLRIRNPRERVMTLLKLTNLDQVFRLADSAGGGAHE